MAAMPDLKQVTAGERKLDNGVTVYGTPQQVERLARIVNSYPNL